MKWQGEDGTGQLASGGLLACPARSRGRGALSCPSLLRCPRPGPSRACSRGFSLSTHPCKLTITPIAENQQITLLGLLPSQEILGPHADLCVAALGSQMSPAGSRLPAFAHTRSLHSAHPRPESYRLQEATLTAPVITVSASPSPGSACCEPSPVPWGPVCSCPHRGRQLFWPGVLPWSFLCPDWRLPGQTEGSRHGSSSGLGLPLPRGLQATPSETPVLLVENTDSRAPPPTYRLIFIFSSGGPGICIQPTSQCPKTRRRLPTTPLPFTNHTVAF